MGYLNIYVSKDAHIMVKNEQLHLKAGEVSADYPLEDINSLIIENLNTNITTYTLSCLAEQGIVCYVCNQNHLPNGVVLPFCSHYQTLLKYQNQISLPKPLQKQLWKCIIENKIKNQNTVLNYYGKENCLKSLYQSVLSGDSGNNEAKASLIYFKELFGKDFSRRNDGIAINSFLNYGYTIVRGFVARSIVVHGMMPFLGIFHCNQYNQFNLADDIIEVFRPVVDLYIKCSFSDKEMLDSRTKSEICNVVNINVSIDGKKYPLSYAIDIYVQSFQKSLKEKRNHLKVVEICGLEFHQYE